MKSYRPTSVVIAAAVLLAALCTPAQADGKTPINKLTRGSVNFATGWLEVPNQISERRQEGSPLWFVHGTVFGLGMTVTRTLYGVYDIVTFPFPPYDKPAMDPDTLIRPRTPPRHLEKPTQG